MWTLPPMMSSSLGGGGGPGDPSGNGGGGAGAWGFGGGAGAGGWGPGGGSPTTILDDEFTGSVGLVTAHTSDSGHTWADTSATMFFDGGTAGDAANLNLNGSGALRDTHTSGAPFPSVVASASIPANCFVEAHITGTAVESAYIGFAWRYDPVTGAGYFLGINGGNGTSNITMFVQAWQGGADPGELTSISGSGTYTVANPHDFVIRIEMNASALTIKIDGASAATGTSTHVSAAGQVGLWLESFGSGHSGDAVIDYIKAGSL